MLVSITTAVVRIWTWTWAYTLWHQIPVCQSNYPFTDEALWYNMRSGSIHHQRASSIQPMYKLYGGNF